MTKKSADTTATVEAVAKSPSKKSQALAIFSTALAARASGAYPTNKEFRAAVLAGIKEALQVSTASAATMYNAAKKDAEAANAEVKLGRDPKKEKVKTVGQRGRPRGSKNKAKDGEVSPTVAVVGVNVAPAEPAVEAQPEPAEA